MNKRFHLGRNLVLLGFCLAALAGGFTTASRAAEAKGERQLSLATDYLPDRIGIVDSWFGAHTIRLNVKLDAQGGGTGALSLDPNSVIFDKFGDLASSTEIAIRDVAVTLKLEIVNKGDGRARYEIVGQSLTKRLFLIVSPGGGPNRLIIAEKDGAAKYVLTLR